MNTIALIQTFCKVEQHCNFTGPAKSLNISAAEALQHGLLVDVLPGVIMPKIPLFLYYNPAKSKLCIEAMVSALPVFM